jgi:DNA adenine methylase
MKRDASARPVLKWAGGKAKLAESICALLPEEIETYYEPFVGGAAVFFTLAKQEGRFRRAVLSDSNPELIKLYQAVKTDVESVIKVLQDWQYSEQEFYRLRDTYHPRSPAACAARTIYLNKTGYNGLYRVNRSGQFNVPFGRHTNPTICDAQNLRLVSECLKKVELVVADFETICARSKPGDAVYFDPPYLPISETAYFTSYDKQPFGIEEHRRLARLFAHLAKRKVLAVLSNSDTTVTRKLFEDWSIQHLQVPRAINSRATARGPVSELLVINRPSHTRRARRPHVNDKPR